MLLASKHFNVVVRKLVAFWCTQWFLSTCVRTGKFNDNGRRSRQRPHQMVRADQDHISRRKRWRSPSAEIETVLAHFSNHFFRTVADAVHFNHLRRRRSNAYHWVCGLRSGPSATAIVARWLADDALACTQCTRSLVFVFERTYNYLRTNASQLY